MLLAKLVIAHMVAEYLFQTVSVLRWKRASKISRSWALAAGLHFAAWAGLVGLVAVGQTEPWKIVAAWVAHGAFDCTPLGDWIMEKSGLTTVRSAVFVTHENQLPPQVAALEFALAAAQEWFARLTVHVLILWAITP